MMCSHEQLTWFGLMRSTGFDVLAPGFDILGGDKLTGSVNVKTVGGTFCRCDVKDKSCLKNKRVLVH